MVSRQIAGSNGRAWEIEELLNGLADGLSVRVLIIHVHQLVQPDAPPCVPTTPHIHVA